MADINLSLGSNLGDRADNIRRALTLLAPAVVVQKISGVYESEPMYLTEQPLFYNIALKGTTKLEPVDLLRHLKSIEQTLGRVEGKQNAPREIDIDILFYDDLILDTSELTIPHPRLHERPFVLVPLEEIDRFLEHPVLRRPIIELWDALGDRSLSIWKAEEQI
jgi:2-amino-4-hydroxy-6-hydroxymethyldihydropteridine diphosphokinase